MERGHMYNRVEVDMRAEYRLVCTGRRGEDVGGWEPRHGGGLGGLEWW
jgi:hypothetical protein